MSRIAIAGVPVVLVPALGVAQGGFHPDAWVWAGALAAWAAALGVVVTDRVGALRAAWIWPATAVALLVWTLASAIWSAEPQQSLLEARRMLVYTAAVLALVVLARRGASWTIVVATHLAVTGLVGYALLRYLFGARVRVPFEGYAISQPLGYANAIGVLAAIGIVLALAPVQDVRNARLRAFAGASVPPLALALTLSGSNASWLALAIGVVAVVMLAPEPTRVARTAALLAAVSAPVVALARYSHFATTPSPRLGGVALTAVAVGAAAAAGIAVVVGVHSGPSSRGPRRLRMLVAMTAIVAVVGAAGALASGGARQPRSSYYHVAWHELAAHPLLGSGAGTFGRYWVRSGFVGRWGGALDAHSLYLETLAELGPVGLLLLAPFLLYPLVRVAAARHTPGVPAAAGAAIVFLVHAGLDWDWELPAVVVSGIACLGAVLLADERERDAALTRPARAVTLALALALGGAAIAGTASRAEPSARPAARQLR